VESQHEPLLHFEFSPSPEPPPQLLTRTGRPQRHYRLPARYEDITPEGPAPLPPNPAPPEHTTIRRVVLHVRDTLRTGLNRFGLLREYLHRPSYDPDSSIPIEDLSNSLEPNVTSVDQHEKRPPPPWPFTSMSVYLVMEWMITGGNQKSIAEVDRLVKEVLSHKAFRPGDLAGFSARRESKRLDAAETKQPETPFSGDGWIHSDVRISVPTGKRDPNGSGLNFSVSGLYHRHLVPVMKAALVEATAARFHLFPFKRIWRLPSDQEVRCFDEVYTSDAFIEANDKLQKQQNEPGCRLEKVILGLMFWSDSTHLTNFGNAKVWPIYLYFANLSKYIRAKPNLAASHHVAYIPSVSLIWICFTILMAHF
jgi:Plavaka transposase